MAWEFGAVCSACDYHWDGILWYERLSVYDAPPNYYFCQKCFAHLCVAPDLDKYSFPKWVARNHSDIARGRLLQNAISVIQEAGSRSSGLLIPESAYSPKLICPSCQRPLISGLIDDHPIVCPNCRQLTAHSTGVHSHVIIVEVDESESGDAVDS